MLDPEAASEDYRGVAVAGAGCKDAAGTGRESGGGAEEIEIYERGDRGIFARSRGAALFRRDERADSGGASRNGNGDGDRPGESADSDGGGRAAGRCGAQGGVPRP